MADQQDRDTAPISDGDITPPPADASFTPAAPLKDAGVDFSPASDAGGETGGTVAGAKQALRDNVAKGREQAADKARLFAEDGKAKASDALGQLSQMLRDAAQQVDEKLGEQYGQYARGAADRVQGFTSAIDDKSVDDLLADARELVRKSPAAAVGVAAGIGFVVARLLSAGLDQRDA
ncbi:hypothetical protein KZ813_07255 [Sphingomonas sp. RHCKR7]|uniref:hypothetical protein n=1 Tax=Sphingomonas folli TaxID=2862497 RepID=UPI001CA49ACA|nr:hypothetical protein [Sphingomonas folli]MBW6526631.1 hypothetical protein [Sphingomonas folli]